MRKASVCGLAAAAVASGLLLASPVHAQTRTTTPPAGQILAGAAGNIGSLAASDGDRRRRGRVSSVGGVGNITGSERARGGVRGSEVIGSGNVRERGTRERMRPGLEQRVRRLERGEISSVGGVGNITGSERARGGVRESTVRESGNVTRARRGRMEQPLYPRMEQRTRTFPRERGEISSVGGVGNITGSERARGGVTGSEVIGSGNVRGGAMERSRGESGVSSVGGVGNVTGSEGATGGVSGSRIESSGNVEE
ncbi:hypothetical protein NE236_29950 [Actinoallomurus purpureus]|uniref:hypothetical protein n=1 Tax=Actinoallomurus purpureus TaxID=478114 RepID=UPI002092E1F0|nr:hypothetical protein [Actinoallomurus purpureus]MCO6009201.1 hypothetical protein [Actinoallomurus purpureus]